MPRFRLHSIDIEIRGPGAEGLAAPYDYFLHRPLKPGEVENYSVTFEIVDGSREISREKNFSYGKMGAAETAPALRTEIEFFLAAQGLYPVRAIGIGLPSGDGVLLLLDNINLLDFEQLAANGCVLLSAEAPLLDRLGGLRAYPFSSLAMPLARPGDRFRPGVLVETKKGDTVSLAKLPHWKASWPLLRRLGSAAATIAGSSFLAQSRAYRLTLTGDARENTRALLLAFGRGSGALPAPHGRS